MSDTNNGQITVSENRVIGVVEDAAHNGHVIAIGNQKGGVGKTTSTVNIAAALGEAGHSVLIIDLDPSGGSTKHLGVNPKQYAGTFELIISEDSPQDLAVVEGLPTNVHLITARTELNEIMKHTGKFVNPTELLTRGLELARKQYDYILLDTCPYANAPTTVAAYSSADWFLLSTFPNKLSYEGLNEAFNDIRDVKSQRNPRLEIIGIIFSNVDRRTKAREQTEAFIREHLDHRAFSVPFIPANSILNKTLDRGKTLFDGKSYQKHEITNMYRTIAREIDARCCHRDEFLAGTLTHQIIEESQGDVDATKSPPEIVVLDQNDNVLHTVNE